MCGKIVGQANMLARPSDPLTAPPPLSTDLLISYQPVIRCHYHNTMSTLAACNTTPPPGLALVASPSTDYYFLVLTHSMITGRWDHVDLNQNTCELVHHWRWTWVMGLFHDGVEHLWLWPSWNQFWNLSKGVREIFHVSYWATFKQLQCGKRYSFEYKWIAKLEKVLQAQNPSKICKCEKSERWKYLVAILSADLEWSDLDGSGISWCLGGMIGELITCLYNNALIICQCISAERENNFRLIPQ